MLYNERIDIIYQRKKRRITKKQQNIKNVHTRLFFYKKIWMETFPLFEYVFGVLEKVLIIFISLLLLVEQCFK